MWFSWRRKHDTVYAFDADATPCETYWSKSPAGQRGNMGQQRRCRHSGYHAGHWHRGNAGDRRHDENNLRGHPPIIVSNGLSTFHQPAARAESDRCIGKVLRADGHCVLSTSGGLFSTRCGKMNRCGAGAGKRRGVYRVRFARRSQSKHITDGWSAITPARWRRRESSTRIRAEATGGSGCRGAPSADSTGICILLPGTEPLTGYRGSDFGDSTVKLSRRAHFPWRAFSRPRTSSLEGSDTDHGSGGAAILVDQPRAPPALGHWRRKRRKYVLAGSRQSGRVRSELESGGF